MAGLLLLAHVARPAACAIDLEVTRLDGTTTRGRLVQVTPEIIIAAPDGESISAWSGVLSVAPVGLEAPAEGTADDEPLRFDLGDGSSFGGRIESATDRGVMVRLRSGQICRVDASLTRTVRCSSASAAARRKLAEAAAEGERSEDIAVIERGSDVIVLRGVIRDIDVQRVVLLWKQRELALPWARIAGLHFARTLPYSSQCTVRLYNRDVFCGRVVAGDGSTVTLQSAVFERLALPWSQIERIDCRSPRLTFLSDLVELRYEFTPFFHKRWDYACDRTLTGRPIRLAGRRYPKGVTVHSRSTLAYALKGEYLQFAATVGIADEMGDRGDVTLAVVGDGRVLWEARDVRGGEEPREILVDVGGVRELSLQVDFGDALDLSDHVCWAMARLIR